MENKLTDLNNILFEQIECLNDNDLHGDALKQQIKKSQAIESIAGMIIANANTVLKAESAYMARNRLYTKNKELTRTGVALAKLGTTIVKKGKNK